MRSLMTRSAVLLAGWDNNDNSADPQAPSHANTNVTATLTDAASTSNFGRGSIDGSWGLFTDAGGLNPSTDLDEVFLATSSRTQVITITNDSPVDAV